MPKQLDFENYQPLPFCKFDCPNMQLDMRSESLYGDGKIFERCVTIFCEHEEVCKAARRQMHDECVQAIPE